MRTDDAPTNGHAADGRVGPRPRRDGRRLARRDDLLARDDAFACALRAQGPDGRRLRVLYLQEAMITYRKRVLDEPLHE